VNNVSVLLQEIKMKEENANRGMIYDLFAGMKFFTLSMYKFYLAAVFFKRIENLNMLSGLSS
jgi:hypothetical protein